MRHIRSVPGSLFDRVREILASARASAVRSVNTAHVVANWLIGREIVEEEQKGLRRAAYGGRVIEHLSDRLVREVGRGYTVRNLETFRAFYLGYPDLGIPHAVRAELAATRTVEIGHAVRGRSRERRAWRPGRLHSSLSWTHYRTLLRVDPPAARSFYEIEVIRNHWSARELERQINSSLYERLALSRDRKGVMRLARKGQVVQQPSDVIKDPVVMEFLGLPRSPRLAESDLEAAMLNHLQAFLLELGKGFAFVARQERLTLDGDHFYIDLVFYHTVLKCFVIIDLKAGKLTHQDLGQLQLYVNYYDRERRTPGDAPTLGLILCADKNDAVVRYTLGPDQRKVLFASRYKLHLPTETELRREMRREVREMATPSGNGPSESG